MKRAVSFAKLHDLIINLPGVGLLQGNVLPPANKSLPGLKMVYTPEGLLVTISAKDHLVPAANVQWVTFSDKPEDK